MAGRFLLKIPPARALRPHAIAILTLAALIAGRSKRAPQLATIVAIGLLGRASGLPLLARAARWACRRWFLLPSIFFETGPDITEWLA